MHRLYPSTLLIFAIVFLKTWCISQVDLPENSSDSLLIFYLENTLNQKQKVVLRASNAYDMVYTEQLSDSTVDEVKHYLNGFFVQLDSSSSKFEINTERIHTIYENGIRTVSTVNYESYFSPDSTNIRNIRLDEINSITYSSPARNTVHVIGNITITASLITSILFAPLISIDYQNGHFNQDRYYTIAGLGLAGLAVSLPIASFSRPKVYKFQADKSSKRGNLWVLRKKHILPIYF